MFQMLQKSNNSCKDVHNSVILQQDVFISKTQEKMAAGYKNLSVLNRHLTVPTFKMETAEVIRNSICKGEWVAQ